MLECWSEKSKRPTFAQLKLRFDKMLLESNHYIQFGSYVNLTQDVVPPEYDHLSHPSVSTEPLQQDTNSHTSRKRLASRTLSAPLVDTDSNIPGAPSVPTILRSVSNVAGVKRTSSNPYVQTPVSRSQVNGAEVKVKGDGKSGGSGGRGSKKVIGERKRRVNSETRRTAHLKVPRVNVIEPTVSFDDYDHLDIKPPEQFR